MTLLELLQQTPVTALPQPKDTTITEMDANETPLEVARILVTQQILSAPVRQGSEYVGFFDVHDLLNMVVEAHKEHQEANTWWETLQSVFGKKKSMVASLAAQNPWISLTEQATVYDFCQALHSHQCHRVALVDANGTCVRILTQGTLVRFLVQHKNAPEFTKSLIPTVCPADGVVLQADEETLALEVFGLMDANRVSSIAIVDEDGELVANASTSDIGPALWLDGRPPLSLHQDVMSYVAQVRRLNTSLTRYPVTKVPSTATIGQVVSLLTSTGYHRLFVVNDERKPVGIVSVTDLVRYILEAK